MSRRYSTLAMIAVVAVIAVFGSLTAAAQSTTSPSMPKSVDLSSLYPGNRAGIGMAEAAGIHPYFHVGWNYVHPYNCSSYYYAGSYYTVVYLVEGGYLYTTDTNFQHGLVGACQTGNWVAFYVYDIYNDWNVIYTYTYS